MQSHTDSRNEQPACLFLWCGRLACIAIAAQDAPRFLSCEGDAGETPAPQQSKHSGPYQAPARAAKLFDRPAPGVVSSELVL
jgi:hypothetical protein